MSSAPASVTTPGPERAPESSPGVPAPTVPSGLAQQPLRPAPAAAPVPLPDALARYRWVAATMLEPGQLEALLAAVRDVPRPPPSMQRLLSPEFLARAKSTELAELVMGEPLIAARVLSTVNSPLYGLQKTVTHIGQAVTFLGMNTVRNICLQYMLAEVIKPREAAAQQAFDTIWRASAIASELSVRLTKALNMPDSGAISTRVVLSFVGQLAMASLLPTAELSACMGQGKLARVQREQDLLGLNATEVGSLLMRHWELPEALVDEVNRTGRQLVTPFMLQAPHEAPGIAVGYLCALLGERLAEGQLTRLDDYDPQRDHSADAYHLRASLAHPALARLPQALVAPDLLAAIKPLATSRRI